MLFNFSSASFQKGTYVIPHKQHRRYEGAQDKNRAGVPAAISGLRLQRSLVGHRSMVGHRSLANQAPSNVECGPESQTLWCHRDCHECVTVPQCNVSKCP